jgi:citrate lyase gamma subunit
MPFVYYHPETGAIVKISTTQLPNTQFRPHDHPEVQGFLENRGVDPATVKQNLDELRRSDLDMTRTIEDVVTALLKKGVLRMSDLPKEVQDRMALRMRIRAQITEAYDRASSARS